MLPPPWPDYETTVAPSVPGIAHSAFSAAMVSVVAQEIKSMLLSIATRGQGVVNGDSECIDDSSGVAEGTTKMPHVGAELAQDWPSTAACTSILRKRWLAWGTHVGRQFFAHHLCADEQAVTATPASNSPPATDEAAARRLGLCTVRNSSSSAPVSFG